MSASHDYDRERLATLDAELDAVKEENACLKQEVRDLEQELERAQRQTGTCSVCGFVAWRNRDAATEECQYCKLERAAAEMREALEAGEAAIWDSHYGHRIDVAYARNVTKKIKSALSPDAGRDYVRKEDVKPLAKFLQTIWDEFECGYIISDGKPSECGECGSIGAHSVHCFQGKLEKVMAHAKENLL